MKSLIICTLVFRRWRSYTSIILLGYALVFSPSVTAAEIITMELESQVLDLDSGTVDDALPTDLTTPPGADVQLAYNADRTPHAVVIPVSEGVEMAFLASVGFDDISSTDVPTLVFSTEPTDLSLSANDCVVIRTDQGTLFKLGNASENGLSITFHYEAL